MYSFSHGMVLKCGSLQFLYVTKHSFNALSSSLCDEMIPFPSVCFVSSAGSALSSFTSIVDGGKECGSDIGIPSVLICGPSDSGKSKLLEIISSRQGSRPWVKIISTSPSKLSSAATGDLPHAIHRLFGAAEVHLSRNVDGIAEDNSGGGASRAPVAIILVDDLHEVFPTEGLKDRAKALATIPAKSVHHASDIESNENISDEVTFADALRAWVVHSRRLTTKYCGRFLVIATASFSSAVALPAKASFRQVVHLQVLSAGARASALSTAVEHYKSGCASSNHVRFASQQDIASIAAEQCTGYVLGDIVRVARDAAALTNAASVRLATGGTSGKRVCAAAVLRSVIAGHVPMAMLSLTASGKKESARNGAGVNQLSRVSPPTSLPGLVSFIDHVGATSDSSFGDRQDEGATHFNGASGRGGSFYGWSGGAGVTDDDDDDGNDGGGGGSIAPALASLLRPERPSVAWEDVGGQVEAKRALHDLLLWPLAHRSAVRALGLQLPTGILLYGPPGTGKTLLAKAVASSLGARFISISIPSVLRPGVGDSERALAVAFALARASAPCVVFLDEVQALIPARSSGSGGGGDDEGARMSELLTATLLACMDALRSQGSDDGADSSGSGSGDPSSESDVFSRRVVVLAATNVPEALDPALLRPGRFDRCVHVGLPDAGERAAILRRVLGRMNVRLDAGSSVADGGPDSAAEHSSAHTPSGDAGLASPFASAAPPRAAVDVGAWRSLDALCESLSWACGGFSGADLANLARRAATLAVRELQDSSPAPVVGPGETSGVAGSSGQAHVDGRNLCVAPTHLWAALRQVTASCPPARVSQLQRWRPAAE